MPAPAAFLGSGLLFLAGDAADAPPVRFGGLPRPRDAAFLAPLASATGAGAAFLGDSLAGSLAAFGVDAGFAGAAPYFNVKRKIFYWREKSYFQFVNKHARDEKKNISSYIVQILFFLQ